MFRHSTNTASFFSVLIVALIFSLSPVGVAAAQTNTSLGTNALVSNTTGINNTAIGVSALRSNTTGNVNTAIGFGADADFRAGNLNNATAIGNGANVSASNKIRLGNTAVTVIEGQVAFTCQFRQDQEGKLPAGGWRRIAREDSRL